MQKQTSFDKAVNEIIDRTEQAFDLHEVIDADALDAFWSNVCKELRAESTDAQV